MSVHVRCDRCGRELEGREGLNVFRMWNLRRADTAFGRNMNELVYDEDWHLCDGCHEKLWALIEREVGRGSE